MAWLTELRDNPFAPALRLLAARAGQPGEEQGVTSPAKVDQQLPPDASAGGASGGGRSSAANDREEKKMQQYMRQFEEQAEKEARKKKMQALKREREASDPCKWSAEATLKTKESPPEVEPEVPACAVWSNTAEVASGTQGPRSKRQRPARAT